ncbi:MAG: hypothetical protein L0Z46_07900 [Nitrospiraceae bacterium]|nr:hypothetical protein [Nitrospiraceae bacterium]
MGYTIRRWLIGIVALALAATSALAKDGAGQEPPASLVEKQQKLHEAVQAAQKAGKDLSPVAKIMEEFEPFVKEQHFKEAETVLDRP